MIRKQVLVFLSSAFILASGILMVQGQDKPNEVRDIRITIKMNEKPIYCIFRHLFYEYDISIGFEESTLDKDHADYRFQTNVRPPEKKDKVHIGNRMGVCSEIENETEVENHLISLNMENARVEDVFNEIVKQMQNYDWAINNEVINIFPKKGRNPFFEKLLNLKVRKFRVSKGQEVSVIRDSMVFSLPEFRTFVAENNLFAEQDRDDVLEGSNETGRKNLLE